MAGLSTGAGAAVVKVYHEKSMILPDVSRVLACLYEKDVKFECVKGSYKDILRLQAARSVPVPFYDGPTFLQESRAICRYIAETYEQRGYPFLLGKDVLERASIEQWLRHEEHAFDPPSRALFCHLAFPLHDEDNDDIDREKRKLEEVLEVYEQRLGESEFLAGNEFTLADLVHLPNTHHTMTSEKFAYLYDSRKNVQRWWNTISARDSWQQVLWYMKSVEEQYQMEELEVAAKDAQGETASGARDITKEAREADQRRVTSAPTQELPSSVQNGQQQSKAPPTDLKVSDSSPLGAEFKEDIQGAMSGDERFSTQRLRKMFEESEAEAPKSDSTDLQAPVKEETPSIYKTPSDVQDRKRQFDTVLADGTTGTPSSGTRVPDTPTSADERRATSQPKGDQASDQAPPLPSFTDTRNNKTGIAEAGRTNTIAPDEQPGGRIPKNAGAPAAGPSPMKSQKNMNEAYNDGPSKQQLSNDQSRALLAENKTKHGDDATPLTEIGKPKEDGFLVNANQNNTGQAQVASTDGPSKLQMQSDQKSTDGPSKLQMQSDQNKPISSKDIGKRNNETVSYRSSATSREMLPSVPEKSMGENQLQGDKSSISLQDTVKQGSEAAQSVSGTEQPKKRDLLANADQNSGKTPGEALQMSEEQNTSDTQQMKSNTSNSKSDGSSKPTQFDGNEGNLPESQRHGSSTNP